MHIDKKLMHRIFLLIAGAEADTGWLSAGTSPTAVLERLCIS